ncbi:hypothetical protein [Paenibacillus sp. FSL L8-0494]|uniref:hypothetical protein n=1 Tax=Paenibacillus sp. FSL L8-0494 TaxID=2975352 RepID=UPI0030F62D54
MSRKIIVHTFYAGGKAVCFSEWYEPLDEYHLRQKAAEFKERGYGEVDTVTDGTGRLVKLS